MHTLFAIARGTEEEDGRAGRGGREERGRRKTGENKPMRTDTASMRKPTGRQLSEGASLVGVLVEDGWNAPRTGRKAADIPKFATARGPGKGRRGSTKHRVRASEIFRSCVALRPSGLNPRLGEMTSRIDKVIIVVESVRRYSQQP